MTAVSAGWLPLVAGLSVETREEAARARDVLAFLLEKRPVEPVEILRAQSRFLQVPFVDLTRYAPDPECLALVGEEQARRLQVVPLFRVDRQLFVALGQPQDLRVLDRLSHLTGLEVEPVLALPADIDVCLNRLLLTADQSERAMEAIAAATSAASVGRSENVMIEDREAPVIKLVDRLLSQAVRLGASDIHVEPFRDRVLLRYRVDGVLQEYPGPPRAMFAALVSRIKISSGLNIAERRLPQDGRTQFSVDGREYDLRVSVIPNLHGEGVVIRILNPYAVRLDLEALGFSPDLLMRYDRMLKIPHGVVLVTGPTGSGKSTTLYATLRRIADPRKKVITLEDPVEYQLPGVTQIQIQPEIGYTFGEGLKAILRHDPDVLLVGEMRDSESAQIAIRAALTGHQLFSTLHTNSAVLALSRLVDMGVPLYQVLSALNGVVAQRLLRRLCPRCRELWVPEDSLLQRLRVPREALGEGVFRAVGCEECGGLGYRGRVAAYELLEIVPAIRRMDPHQLRWDELLGLAVREDAFLSLSECAVDLWLRGVTYLDEVLAVAGEECR